MLNLDESLKLLAKAYEAVDCLPNDEMKSEAKKGIKMYLVDGTFPKSDSYRINSIYSLAVFVIMYLNDDYNKITRDYPITKDYPIIND